DLPSSGHTVSFFQSPLGVKEIFKVGFVHTETEKILGMFRSPDVRLDLVAIPEELPVVECRELKERLAALHDFQFGYLHVNQSAPKLPVPESYSEFPDDVRDALHRFETQRRKQEAC